MGVSNIPNEELFLTFGKPDVALGQEPILRRSALVE